jgi:FixJ family two-component response regulator
MAEKSGFEGIYRSVDSPKRRQEVLDRLLAGQEPKRIATDLGMQQFTVEQIAEGLRGEGKLPPQPPD